MQLSFSPKKKKKNYYDRSIFERKELCMFSSSVYTIYNLNAGDIRVAKISFRSLNAQPSETRHVLPCTFFYRVACMINTASCADVPLSTRRIDIRPTVQDRLQAKLPSRSGFRNHEGVRISYRYTEAVSHVATTIAGPNSTNLPCTPHTQICC